MTPTLYVWMMTCGPGTVPMPDILTRFCSLYRSETECKLQAAEMAAQHLDYRYICIKVPVIPDRTPAKK
jgi:hypothetical protein